MVDAVFILDHRVRCGGVDADVYMHDRCDCLFCDVDYNRGLLIIDLKAFCGSRGWCVFVVRGGAPDIIGFLDKLRDDAVKAVLNRLLHDDFWPINMIKYIIGEG